MRIYRFAPDIRGYSHPWRPSDGRWWPQGIELGRWMTYAHGASNGELAPPAETRYDHPTELPLSDFPWLSLQVPVVSERAAEQLGTALAERLRPMKIGEHRFFAVQPRFAVRGEPHAFIAEASSGISLPHGEIVHYHTRVFDPSRIESEWFTIPAHEPYAETYVTGALVDRMRDAGLTGLAHLELVFDDGPVVPAYPRPLPDEQRRSSARGEEEWELFRNRGFRFSYVEDDLRAVFDRAVLDGLMPIHDP